MNNINIKKGATKPRFSSPSYSAEVLTNYGSDVKFTATSLLEGVQYVNGVTKDLATAMNVTHVILLLTYPLLLLPN